jgi:hypothetical protein
LIKTFFFGIMPFHKEIADGSAPGQMGRQSAISGDFGRWKDVPPCLNVGFERARPAMAGGHLANVLKI